MINILLGAVVRPAVAVRRSKAWRRKSSAAPWIGSPQNFCAARWCGAEQRGYSCNSLYPCAQRFCCRHFELGLALDHTPSDDAWPLAGCPFGIDDPTPGQIARRHFHVCVVSSDRADAVTAHFTCRAGDGPMLIAECHAEASVRQDLGDLAFRRHELFLRQTSSSRTNNRPRTGMSRRRAMQHEREEAGRRCGYQIPSQTTIGRFHIMQYSKIASWLACRPARSVWLMRAMSRRR